MNIVYWCPYLTNVATIRSVLNSYNSLKKSEFVPFIINSCGEWQFYDKNYKLINFLSNFNLHKYLPKEGFLKSRISFIIISIISILPLLIFLKKKKPKFLVIHLLTSLPLIINSLFKIETKVILRISGLPRLSFFRKCLWKWAGKKVYAITVPTEETYLNLKHENIFDEKKLHLLRDPVIDPSRIEKNIHINDNFLNKKFLLSVGRLTKQKNHSFLIKNFFRIEKDHKDLELIILGEGEMRKKLENIINKCNLNNKVHLLGFQNPEPYYKNAYCFISCSLWEDPGFAMIEAAYFNCSIISSDCKSGPKEFISDDKAGFLFKNNNDNNFVEQFQKFYNSTKEEVFKKKILAKKKAKLFSKFNHKKKLIELLDY